VALKRALPWLTVEQRQADDRLLFIKRYHRQEDALAEAKRQIATRPASTAVLVHHEVAWAGAVEEG